MFWQENPKEEHFTLPDTVQDAVFTIDCKILPIDHAYLLYAALQSHLLWLADANAGIFNIGIADGNGWEQNHKNGFYYPSKRTKLSLRLPKQHLADSAKLVGETLHLGEYQIKISKQLPSKLLSDSQILFAKRVVCDEKLSEDDFLQNCHEQLQSLNITPKKMMAGLTKNIKTNNDKIYSRALMVADLSKSESVTLQEKGIGKHRLLGCGLFLPQKDIADISV